MLITTFAEVVEKPFMATEFVLNIQSWLATSCYCVGTIWKTKDFWNHVLKVKHFWQSHSFRFYYKGVQNKRKLLKTQKQVLFFRLTWLICLVDNKKYWAIYYEEMCL